MNIRTITDPKINYLITHYVQPKDTFENIPYAVLGLGDTNYDQFCHMGKMIDKRLKELGGNRLHPLCCADEATGLEETVEGWKAEIMTILGKLDQLIASQATTVTESTENASVVPPTEPVVDIALLQALTISPNEDVPSGLLSLSGVSDWLDLSNQVQSNPEKSQLPNSEKVLLNGPVVKIETNKTSDVHQLSRPTDGWTAEVPFYAPISAARWLTAKKNVFEDPLSWGETKRVIHLEFDLSQSGMEYVPGDSLGICCPNPSHLVESVFKRLKETHVDPSFSLETVISTTTHGEEVTLPLKEILNYK